MKELNQKEIKEVTGGCLCICKGVAYYVEMSYPYCTVFCTVAAGARGMRSCS